MSDNKVQAYRLPPDKMFCCSCGANIESAGLVTHGTPRGFSKGHIMVCGHCSSVNIMGDSQFHTLTPVEIKKLPKETQKTLELTVEMIRRNILNRDSTNQV